MIIFYIANIMDNIVDDVYNTVFKRQKYQEGKSKMQLRSIKLL